MDRRLFSRLCVDLEGLSFFLDDEHPSKIVSLSEEGIGFVVNKNQLEKGLLKKGDEIYVEFVDEVRWFGRVLEEIHIMKVRIAQIRCEGEDYYLGCRVIYSENDYKTYVERKKCACFLKALRNFRTSWRDANGS